MSVESVQRKIKPRELTLDVILSALKHALNGKFESDKINQAMGELGTERSWFDQKKGELKEPEDLLKMSWSGVLFSAGLPMSEEETESVVTAAVHSLLPDPAVQSFQSIGSEGLEPSGSALDLVAAEEDFLKVVEELKVESETLTTGDLKSEDEENKY